MVVRSPVCIRRSICFLPSTTALTQQGRVAASCTEKRSPAASDPAAASVPDRAGDPAGGAGDRAAPPAGAGDPAGAPLARPPPCVAGLAGAAAGDTAAAVVPVDAGAGSEAG